MFGFGLILKAAWWAVRTAIEVAIRAAIAAARFVVNKFINATLDNSPVWERVLTGHLDKMAILRSRNKQDIKNAEALFGDKDNDGNGIPDMYDQAVTSPLQDVLHIKYPATLLRQNDYVRLLPRAVTHTVSAVAPGSKGIVRSEELSLQGVGGGQYCTVKWNAHHIIERVNALDLNVLGHVYNSAR